MSDQLTSQSRSNESGITRRTALRGAAWSVPAVTVVVAAPAYAVASNTTPTATATDTGSTRDGAKLSLKSQLQAAAGPQAITGLKAVVTVSEGTIASVTTPAGWTLSGTPAGSTATFVYIGDLAGAATAAFAPVVTLSTNPTASVTSSINFTWTTTGSALLSIPLAYVAPTADIQNAVAGKYSVGNVKHVKFTLDVTNTSQTQTLRDLKLDFAWSADVEGNRATGFTVVTPSRTWKTTMSDLTALLSGETEADRTLAPGQKLTITADFVNRDNSTGTVGVEVFAGTTRLAGVLGVKY